MAQTGSYVPSIRDEAVRSNTGRGWQEWFGVLDAWGAEKAGHKATARWLQNEQGLSGWWAQSVTVEYERARGLRAVGQRSGGDFEVTAQRTVAVPLEDLAEALVDGRQRRRWLDDGDLAAAFTAGMRQRTETKPPAMFDRVVRLPLEVQGQRGKLELQFIDKGDRSVVRVQLTGLDSAKARDTLKPRMKQALDALKAHLG